MIEEHFRGIRGYREGSGLKKWYPSVSAVLDVLDPAPMEWIDQADLDEGTACHKETENALTLLRDGQDPFTAITRPRVRTFVDWFLKQGFLIEAIEKPAMSKSYCYAGTPDIVVRDNIKKGHILDAKYAESVQGRYLLQVEMYCHLDIYKGYSGSIVRVSRAGELKVLPVKSDPGNWAACISAVGVLRWRLR